MLTIHELLGAGGMGEVYRAELRTHADDGTEVVRPVALKYMRPTDDERLIDLFEREARVIAGLSHPTIVALIDIHRGDHNQLALVMELVDGIALSRLTNEPLPLPVAVAIAGKLLEALAHAHERGIVHRDVTPHNVLISRAGEVKLADFGLAKILDSTAPTLSGAKGKVGYMAPEQALDHGVDQRTDLFALGIVLYQLTTGTLPFGGGPLRQFAGQLLEGTFAPPREHRPDIQPELEAIIVRLLEHDRDNRFASAADVQAALAALPAADASELAELVLGALATARPQPGPRLAGERPLTRTAAPSPRRRNRWSAAAVSAALAACVATWMLMEHQQRSLPSLPAMVTHQSTTTPPPPSAKPAPSKPSSTRPAPVKAPSPQPSSTRPAPVKASSSQPSKPGTASTSATASKPSTPVRPTKAPVSGHSGRPVAPIHKPAPAPACVPEPNRDVPKLCSIADGDIPGVKVIIPGVPNR